MFENLSGWSATTVVRAIRLVRVFKLFSKNGSLRVIIDTFVLTLPALMNVGSLLLLLIYIYTILGINLFAEIKITNILNDHINF